MCDCRKLTRKKTIANVARPLPPLGRYVESSDAVYGDGTSVRLTLVREISLDKYIGSNCPMDALLDSRRGLRNDRIGHARQLGFRPVIYLSPSGSALYHSVPPP